MQLALPVRLAWPVLAPRYWVVAGQAVVSGTSFLTNLFVARLCGLAGFGAYSAWQLVLLLALAGQGAVLTQPMQVVLGSLPAGQRRPYQAAVLGGQVLWSGLAAAAVALLAGGLPQADAGALPAFGVLLVAAGTQDTLRKLLLAQGQVRAAFGADALSAGGQLLVLALLAARPAAPALADVLWAVGLTTLPALALAGGALGTWPALRPWRRFGGRHWRRVRWLLPTALLQWASANGLLVFAGWAGPAAMLGVLRLAQTAMGVFNLGLQAVENYALPRLSQLYHAAPAGFGAARAALARRLWLAGSPPLAGLALAAGPLLARFGPAGAAPYADVLRWCCALYAVILLVYPLRLTVRLLPDARHYFGGYVLSLAASWAAVRWLVSNYQASGVVLAWLLAQVVLGGYWGLVAVRQKGAGCSASGIRY